MAKPPKRKRSFGDVGLPVSQKYIYPTARRKMILVGAAAAAGLALFVMLDVQIGSAAFICSGPLSYNHAKLQDDCSRCHDPFGSVGADKCKGCHERFDAEHGIYTLEAHYVYRSNDSSRATDAGQLEHVCADCHVEHLGREAELTQVSDERCLACHTEFGRFPDHPDFDASLTTENAGLHFPHIDHIVDFEDEGVMGLLPTGAGLEAACLNCHRPDRQGKGFEPLDYDSLCGDCHLDAVTPYLPVRSADRLGVETPESLKSLDEKRWAGLNGGSDVFDRQGRELKKRSLDHKDPWILENLDRFHDAKELLRAWSQLVHAASREETFDDQRDSYDVLIKNLQKLVQRSSLPAEQAWAERSVQQLQQALAQEVPLTDRVLRRAMGGWKVAHEGQLAVLEGLAEDISRPCRKCHELDGMRIAAVESDQHTLRRAEFDHRAHVLVLSCLDCHASIPIREAFDGKEDVDRSSDQAATQNLPGIDKCKNCHSTSSGSHACVTCHYFHPNKERASGLLASRDVAE